MNVSNMYVGAAAQNPTGFQSLGKTTLSGAATTMSVTFPARKNLQFVITEIAVWASITINQVIKN